MLGGSLLRWHHAVLGVFLVVAYALRLVLVRGGGQYFWLDESHRFHPCLVLVSQLENGDLAGALKNVLSHQAHTGFFLTGIPVAAAYIAIAGFSAAETLWIPASFLAGMSVIAIGLVYAVARSAGADRDEGLIAALCLASSTTMFYGARHILPYDTAVAFTLCAMWMGSRPDPSPWRSVLFGVVASIAFLSHYGHAVGVMVVAADFVLGGERPREILARAMPSALGFLLLPLSLQVATTVAGLPAFIPAAWRFMTAGLEQGYFAEGWSVPWEYLWEAEHGLFLLWAVGAAVVVAGAVRGHDPAYRRGLRWLVMALAIYAFLAFNSSVLHGSVVFGRVARQLVPFLCLATGCAIARVLADRSWRRFALGVGAMALAAQVAVNFSPPLKQQFAGEVERELVPRYAPLGLTREMSVEGPEWYDMNEATWPSRYVLLNTATFPYPVKGPKVPRAEGRVLFQTPHPLQFNPYQYEVFGPTERAIVRSTDISIRLLDTSD